MSMTILPFQKEDHHFMVNYTKRGHNHLNDKFTVISPFSLAGLKGATRCGHYAAARLAMPCHWAQIPDPRPTLSFGEKVVLKLVELYLKKGYPIF